MKIFNFSKKINLLDSYLVISFIFIWLSINSGPIDIYKFFENLNFIYLNLFIPDKYPELFRFIINFVRAISPILILIINILIIFYSFDKKMLNKFNKNYSILFFLFFSVLQIFVLIVLKQDNFFYSIYWNFSMLSVLTIYLILINNNKNYSIIFLYISISLLWIVLCTFLIPVFKNYLFSETTLYGTEMLSISSYSFDQPRPRVTGLSRIALILYIFHLCIFLRETITRNLKIINSIMFIILSTIIFLFLSRGAVGGLIITNFLLFFIYKNIKFYKKIFFIFFLIIIPILLAKGINSIKANFFIKDEKVKVKFIDNSKSEIQLRYFGFIEKYRNDVNKDDEKNNNSKTTEYKNWSKNKKITVFLSERNLFWKAIINKSKENIFFGFGTQADRRFTGMPVSNGYLYILICGGIISLISFIIFLIFLVKNMFLIIKYRLINNNSYILNISIMISIFLMFRILFENTFLIFGIDFLMFIQSSIYLENKLKK